MRRISQVLCYDLLYDYNLIELSVLGLVPALRDAVPAVRLDPVPSAVPRVLDPRHLPGPRHQPRRCPPPQTGPGQLGTLPVRVQGDRVHLAGPQRELRHHDPPQGRVRPPAGLCSRDVSKE